MPLWLRMFFHTVSFWRNPEHDRKRASRTVHLLRTNRVRQQHGRPRRLPRLRLRGASVGSALPSAHRPALPRASREPRRLGPPGDEPDAPPDDGGPRARSRDGNLPGSRVGARGDFESWLRMGWALSGEPSTPPAPRDRRRSQVSKPSPTGERRGANGIHPRAGTADLLNRAGATPGGQRARPGHPPTPPSPERRDLVVLAATTRDTRPPETRGVGGSVATRGRPAILA